MTNFDPQVLVEYIDSFGKGLSNWEKARIIRTLRWMIATFDWQNEQTGLHVEDSPELKEAKAMFEELKNN